MSVLRAGCAWRPLPLDFPPWSRVHCGFSRPSQACVFERPALTRADRERVRREASPTGYGVDARAIR
ncbi:hypothetical protein [Methylobacterium sp. J-048]|uniref:hypothetical protein n=1 Tax=Methylobacterium sp. J-048 TaxID=2836635 RepID=UPI00391CF2A4